MKDIDYTFKFHRVNCSISIAIKILNNFENARTLKSFIFMPTSSIGYILIGLPGSGKTTLARQIFQSAPYHQIVSTDQIRECLYGSPSIQGHWPTLEHHILTQIQQALQAQKTVIYDATNYNRRHRIDLLQKLSKLSSIQWIGLYLNTPLDQCKLQNRQRDRQVPEDIIEIMDKCLRAFPPALAEGFAKIYQIPGDAAGKIETIEPFKQAVDDLLSHNGETDGD
jgi:predicted kinase